jgi:hypothetical protein
MNEVYTSPVAMPIVANGADDYRTWRLNRKWLVSALVNGKRYYYGQWESLLESKVSEVTKPILSSDILNIGAYNSYPAARHEAARWLTEPSGNGFEMRASADKIKQILFLDIVPRVKIEIAMVETTEMEPAWRTAAYRIMTLADVWHTQYWPGV